MTPEHLDRIIKSFIQSEGYTSLYRLGRCSEFAVALKQFLKSGTIYKHGIWHTVLHWKNYYWDANGKHTARQLQQSNYISAAEQPKPATKAEIQHINKLLNHHIVSKIIKGLKQAQKEKNI